MKSTTLKFICDLCDMIPTVSYSYNPKDFTLTFRIGLKSFTVSEFDLANQEIIDELFIEIESLINELIKEEIEDNAKSNGKRS